MQGITSNTEDTITIPVAIESFINAVIAALLALGAAAVLGWNRKVAASSFAVVAVANTGVMPLQSASARV